MHTVIFFVFVSYLLLGICLSPLAFMFIELNLFFFSFFFLSFIFLAFNALTESYSFLKGVGGVGLIRVKMN